MSKKLLSVLLTLFALHLLTGCRPSGALIPIRKKPTKEALRLEHYGQIDPAELDDTITAGQKEKMTIELDDITFPEIKNHLERTGPPPLASQDSDLQSRKAYLRARYLLIKGRFDQAIDQLNRAIAIDPHWAPLYVMLGRAQFARGKIYLAGQTARHALTLDEESFWSYQLLGIDNLNRGEYLQAAVYFRRALACSGATKNNPATAVIHLQLAGSLGQLGYLHAAAEQYQQTFRLLRHQANYTHTSDSVIQLMRRGHGPLLAVASLQLKMGRLAEAVKTLRQVQRFLAGQADPIRAFILSLTTQRLALSVRYRQVTAMCRYLLLTDYPVEKTLSFFYEACVQMAKQEQYPEELARWQKKDTFGLALITQRQYAYGLAVCDKNDQAEQIFKKQLSQSLPEPLLHRDLARLYAKTKNYRAMIAQYSLYLQARPEETASILAELNQLSPEIPDLPVLIEKLQHDQELTVGYAGDLILGYLAQTAGKEALAEELYRRSLSLKADFTPARMQLIKLLFEADKYVQILEWIDLNGDIVQENPDLLSYLGKAHLGLGNYEQAEKFYRRLIELRQNEIDAYLALAEILYKQNNFRQAEDILLPVLADAPNHLEVYRHLLLLYARWSSQDNLSNQLYSASQRRAQFMLRQWLTRKSAAAESTVTSGDSVSVSDIVSNLAELAGEYPKGRIIGIILAGLYAGQGRYAEAVDRIEQLRNFYDQDEQVLALAARFNEKNGNLNRTAELRRQIWQLKPDDPESFLTALQAISNAGEHIKAQELLLATVREKPWQDFAKIAPLQLEAQRLFKISRQYKKALELFQKWYWLALISSGQTELTGSIKLAAENLIWALTEVGFYDRAILHTTAYYQQYYDKPQQLSYIIYYLMRTVNIRMHYEQSQKLLNQLLHLQPDDPSLRLHLYLTMIEQDQPTDALEAAQRWYADSPEDQRRTDVLIRLYHQVNDYATALELLRAKLTQNQDDPSLKRQIANVLILAGDYDQADEMLLEPPVRKIFSAEWLDALTRLDIARGQCQSALDRIDQLTGGELLGQILQIKAKVLHACGQIAQAVEIQKKLIADDPADTAARLQYSLYLDQMDQPDLAIEQLETILAEYPDSHAIMNNLAYSLIEANRDPNRAYHLLLKSIRSEPDSAPTLDSLGWFYYKEGKFGQALEYIYQAAAAMLGPDAEILEHLGDIHYRLEDKIKAGHYWRQAVDQIKKRVKFERQLETDNLRIEAKLKQLTAGKEVSVTPLFNEVGHDGDEE